MRERLCGTVHLFLHHREWKSILKENGTTINDKAWPTNTQFDNQLLHDLHYMSITLSKTYQLKRKCDAGPFIKKKIHIKIHFLGWVLLASFATQQPFWQCL